MLSIGKIAVGSGGYYVDGIAEGAEDYYAPGDGREPPGEWYGLGAEALGLTGRVDRQQFLDLLANRNPVTGNQLRARPGKIGAFDLTYSAPKSVSLIYAFGTDEQRQAILDAQIASVKSALSWLEAECGSVRTGAQGQGPRMEGNGWTIALFVHQTSREGDPQLHIHAVVANAVQGRDDGRWRSLDGAPMYAAARTDGFMFQAELRHRVSTAAVLGGSWGEVVKGQAELEGASPVLIEGFSQRRAQVLAGAGDGSRYALEAAALDSRRAKGQAARVDIPGLAEHDARDFGVPIGQVETLWRARLTELGATPAEAVGPMIGQAHTPAPVDGARRAAALAAELTSGARDVHTTRRAARPGRRCPRRRPHRPAGGWF